MAKEPMTNKYGSKFTHKGLELTWNAENKSVPSKDEAADFYVGATGAVEKFQKSLEPKKGMSPLAKAFVFMLFAALAVVAANQGGWQLFCHERWCW